MAMEENVLEVSQGCLFCYSSRCFLDVDMCHLSTQSLAKGLLSFNNLLVDYRPSAFYISC